FLFYIYLIKFCFTQNFRNYYLLSIIYYLIPPIISTVASVSERSGEIKALAALLLRLFLYAAVRQLNRQARNDGGISISCLYIKIKACAMRKP
ncbi:hypothetical protein, partial [Anaerocaecibacter muris]|uniref:hypothetical protein n=1 Tax=Anaerocaecibacter muris TaxID=2941513 RepID=UPI003F69106C